MIPYMIVTQISPSIYTQPHQMPKGQKRGRRVGVQEENFKRLGQRRITNSA